MSLVKKLTLTCLLALSLVVASVVTVLFIHSNVTALAEDEVSVEINADNFPDTIFRQYISDNFDLDKNGKLSESEILSATEIGLPGNDVADLTGIKYLTNLRELNCSYCQLTSLDVSGLAYLKTIECDSNPSLTTVNVSNLPALRELSIISCALTSLDISGSTNIKKLHVSFNPIAELDISSLTYLEEIEARETGITKLDLTENLSRLMYIDVSDTKISSIDISKLSLLDSLILDNTLISELDVIGYPHLEYLSVWGCENLTSLNIKKCGNLEVLDVAGTSITSLDVSDLLGLESLTCSCSSSLTTLALGNKEDLFVLDVSGTAITSLDISGAQRLLSVFLTTSSPYESEIEMEDGTIVPIYEYTSDDTRLTVNKSLDSDSIVIGDIIYIDEEHFPDENFRDYVLNQIDYGDGILFPEEIRGALDLYLSYKNISDFTGIEYFEYVEYLSVDGNSFESIDISNFKYLEEFSCENVSSLTTLTLGNHPSLKNLNIKSTAISTLDLSGVPNLESLNALKTNLTSIDTSNLYMLGRLDLREVSSIKEIDVSTNTRLCQLLLSGTGISKLDVSHNAMLYCLMINDTSIQTLDLGNNPHLMSAFVNGEKFTDEGYLGYFLWDDDISDYYEICIDDGFEDNLTFGDKILINSTNFPDEALVSGISAYFDINCDGALSKKEIELVTEIDLGKFGSVYDLTGIEIFTNLEVLKLNSHALTIHELDVSPFANLRLLDLAYNDVASLDLSNNAKLEELDISDAGITSLDLSANPCLITFIAYGSELEEVKFGDLSSLITIDVGYSKLTSLDLTGAVNIEKITICGTEITELDVSEFANLTYLDADCAQLASLDISNNNKLECLYVGGNENLSSLDLSGKTELIIIDISETKISSLNLKDCTKLETLIAYSSPIASLDLTSLKNLEDLDVAGTAITSLDISNQIALISAYQNGGGFNQTIVGYNGENVEVVGLHKYGDGYSYHLGVNVSLCSDGIIVGENIDIVIDETTFPDEDFRSYVSGVIDSNHDGYLNYSERAGLTMLSFGGCSSIKGIEQFFNLNYLSLGGCTLGDVDLSSNPKLTTLRLEGSTMTSLNLSTCVDLEGIYLNGSTVEKLDLSTCTGLDVLSADGSTINTIIFGNIDIEQISLNGSTITALDLSGLDHLYNLSLDGCSNLESLVFGENPLIEEIYIPGLSIKTLDVSKMKNIESIDLTGLPALESITFGNNPKLRWLYIHGTAIEEIDVSMLDVNELCLDGNSNLSSVKLGYQPWLTDLKLDGTAIEKIDLSGAPNLIVLSVNNTQLTELDISSCMELSFEYEFGSPTDDQELQSYVWSGGAIYLETSYDLHDNCKIYYQGAFTNIVAIDEINFPDDNFRQIIKQQCDFDEDGFLNYYEISCATYLDLSSMGIKSLKGIEYFTALTYLYVPFNEIEEVDLSNSPLLQELDLLGNKLTSIDISANKALRYINLAGNDISFVDISSIFNMAYADDIVTKYDVEGAKGEIYDIISYSYDCLYAMLILNADIVPHIHEFSKELSHDGTSHYYECSCGEKISKENCYGGSSDCTHKAVCEVCGGEYGEFGSHTYDDDNDDTCNICGEKRDIGGGESEDDDSSESGSNNGKNDNGGLGGGAIAGIVCGGVAVAGLGGFSIFWFIIKKKSIADLLKIFKK